jgi:hypothetical protein
MCNFIYFVTKIKYIILHVQDYTVFHNNAVLQLYVRVGILLTCGEHLHGRVNSLRVQI